jgi:hypothetical protein
MGIQLAEKLQAPTAHLLISEWCADFKDHRLG